MSRLMERLKPHTDEGMTLIELLISMIILGIIIAPLASSLILGLTTAEGAKQHIENSADAQLVSSYFSTDVASSDEVSKSTGCGGPDTILQLRWTDESTTRVVAYTVTENPAAESDLHTTPVYQMSRAYCESTTGPVLTTDRLARSLTSIPDPQCDSASCPSGPSTPTIVSMAMTEYGASYSTTYDFSITGSRRVTP